MSGNKGGKVVKDFYKILQVSSDATTAEIKTSYRKLALTLHPDRHDGDETKTKAFKEMSEAYNILIDTERRQQYDVAHGIRSPSGWYNRNRRRPPPSNYRKVYAPHPPPDGKWHDAHRHYDMHYGDGLYHEALKDAYKHAEAKGELDYKSPLGKGFTFESAEERKRRMNRSSSGDNTSQSDNSEYNPYSKAQQGPPTSEFDYEESYISEVKQVMKRRRGVVNMLHERRRERLESQKNEIGNRNQPSYDPFTTQQPEKSTAVVGSCAMM